MSFVLLPCEIYHREFDAKLNIATQLASIFSYPCLIGYDKHFNRLSRVLSSSVLLEKSVSSIMWAARIEPTKSRGGSVVVCDEEGFNNLAFSSTSSALNRVDPHASSVIDTYCCWGDIDFTFFQNVPQLSSKLNIVGNSRSDLLSSTGHQLYLERISGLKALFGDFILCTDNFCIENKSGPYSPPTFNVSKEEALKAQEEFRARFQEQIQLRKFFAESIFEAAVAFPTRQFVIRPHPCADPRWWTNYFWSLDNVHVICLHSIDPWLHAASMMISIGCTSALQSVITKTPVIELSHPEIQVLEHNRGYAHHFTPYFASSGFELIKCINAILSNQHSDFINLAKLSKYWHNCFSTNISLDYANILASYCNTSTNSFNLSMDVVSGYSQTYAKNPLSINLAKWTKPSFSSVKDRVFRLLNIHNLERNVSVHKVADCLYAILPS